MKEKDIKILESFVNLSGTQLIEKILNYGFECKAGKLENCVEFGILKKRIEINEFVAEVMVTGKPFEEKDLKEFVGMRTEAYDGEAMRKMNPKLFDKEVLCKW